MLSNAYQWFMKEKFQEVKLLATVPEAEVNIPHVFAVTVVQTLPASETLSSVSFTIITAIRQSSRSLSFPLIAYQITTFIITT